MVLGTNNLDLLVDRVARSQQRNWLQRRLQKLPEKWRSRLTWLDPSASRRGQQGWDAAETLAVIGTNMAPAIPKLKRIAEYGNDPDDYYAVLALAFLSNLGDEGLAAVAKVAAHPSAQVRLRAVPLLATHTKSIIARSALTNALSDANLEVRRAAWGALTNNANSSASAAIQRN